MSAGDRVAIASRLRAGFDYGHLARRLAAIRTSGAILHEEVRHKARALRSEGACRALAKSAKLSRLGKIYPFRSRTGIPLPHSSLCIFNVLRGNIRLKLVTSLPKYSSYGGGITNLMKPGLLQFGLIIALGLAVAAPLGAQTLAQPAASQDCGSSQSCTAHLSSSVTAGNALIAVVRIGQVTSVSGTTITDSMANTWILDAYQAQATDVHLLAVYRVVSAKAGKTVFTVSNNEAQTMRIISLAEVSGLSAGSPDSTAASSGMGTAAQAGALRPSQASDYVLVTASTGNNQSFSTTQPFLMVSQVTKGAYAEAVPTQTAAMTPAISFGVADQWAAIAVAYKASGSSNIPINLSLQYDDGSAVTGSAVLSSLSGGTKTAIQSWTIGANGAVTIYCPKVNTGTYEYDFLDPSGNPLQSYVILPGAFISLISPAHSILGSITLSKANHSVVIPVSFAFQ